MYEIDYNTCSKQNGPNWYTWQDLALWLWAGRTELAQSSSSKIESVAYGHITIWIFEQNVMSCCFTWHGNGELDRESRCPLLNFVVWVIFVNQHQTIETSNPTHGIAHVLSIQKKWHDNFSYFIMTLSSALYI